MNSDEIAKEITIAAIQKLDFTLAASTKAADKNDFVREEVAKLYKDVYKAVTESY